MTVNYTTLLGLAKPVTGTESGTWGDTVNNNLTDYVDAAVAGAQIISGSLTAVTLSKTTGASLSQAGSGSTGSTQYQIIRCTGNPASLLTITISSGAEKPYIVINATSTSQSVKIVGAGPTTGVTIASGKTTMVAWNGSDFVEITPTTASNLAGGGTGQIPYQSASGTTAMLAAGTSGQVLTSAGAAPPTWSTPAAATKTISNKTANYTVVAGDLGKIINCTSGTFTVSLTAAASLGSGFTCTIWNTGTGAITIDPNAAETIDGVATLVLRQGEGLAVVCDGTNWQTDDKKPMRGYAENFANSSIRPIASGISSVAIGNEAIATGSYSVVLGTNYYGANTASVSGAMVLANGGATASGDTSLAIGVSTTAGANYSTAIGINSSAQGSKTATGSGAMALGGSYASGTDSFAAAIGDNTSTYGATGANSIAIGYSAKASVGYGAIAIGYKASVIGTGSTAIGGWASATGGGGSVALGGYALGSSAVLASGNYATAIGQNSNIYGSVAAGSGSTSLGGSYASGTDSFAAVITNNTSSYGATGANGIAIGRQAKVTGANSLSLGYLSVASGATSTVLGGLQSQATGDYSVALGNNALSAQYGKYSYASGYLGTVGDAQSGLIVLRGASTASVAILTSDGSGTASSTNQLALAANQAMVVKGVLIGKQVGGGNGIVAYEIAASAVYVGGTLTLGAGVLTLIGSNTLPGTFTAPTVTADTTNGAIKITSGKSSSTNVYWVCSLQSAEVTGS